MALLRILQDGTVAETVKLSAPNWPSTVDAIEKDVSSATVMLVPDADAP